MGNAYYFCILNHFKCQWSFKDIMFPKISNLLLLLLLFSVPLCGLCAPKIAVVGDARKDFGKYPAKERRDASYTIKKNNVFLWEIVW